MLLDKIAAYIPFNEQEQCDKELLLHYIRQHPSCFSREDATAHVTTSVWTVNPSRTKTLLVYHTLYDSWSWIGGHADGEQDLCAVALRELSEETGIQHATLITDDIFSLEILPVSGHIKKGIYVPSHLHLNITYIAVADEQEPLKVNPNENKDVAWFALHEVPTVSSEPWMIEHIYKKLIQKSGAD